MTSQTSAAPDNTASANDNSAPDFEPCKVGELSDRLRLKSLLRHQGVTLAAIPDDNKSALLEHKGRKLVVRDAVFFGHQPIIEGLRADEVIDDVLAEIVSGLPQSLVDEHCLDERTRLSLFALLDRLMSPADNVTCFTDGQLRDTLRVLHDLYSPKEIQKPNIALFPAKDFACVDPLLARFLMEMNQRFAVIDDKGKIYVHDNVTGNEYTPTAFNDAYTAKVQIEEKDAKGNSHNKSVKKSKRWFESNVRAYYTGRGLFPLGKNSDGRDYTQDPRTRSYFNSWKGYAVTPKPGKCEMFKGHILNIICRGDQEHCDYILDWLAHRVQKPWQKPRVALVLWSKETQIGKSLVADQMRKIIGPHAAIVDKNGHIDGRFANTTKYILIQSEEALFSGDPKTVNLVKHAITSPDQRVETKNDARGEETDYPSYTGYIFISNSEKPVKVAPDEERAFVLNVSADAKGDKKYFQMIINEMNNGGREAFLHELLTRDISKFKPWVMPISDALGKMALENADKLAKKIIEAVQTGEIEIEGSHTIPWPLLSNLTIETDTLLKAFGKAAAAYGEQQGGKVVIGRKLEELGLVLKKIDTDSRRNVKAHYVLPSLEEARWALGKHYRVATTELGAPDDHDPSGWSTRRQEELAEARNALDEIRIALSLPIDDPAYMGLKSRLLNAEKLALAERDASLAA